jgi:hypothetical protein
MSAIWILTVLFAVFLHSQCMMCYSFQQTLVEHDWCIFLETLFEQQNSEQGWTFVAEHSHARMLHGIYTFCIKDSRIMYTSLKRSIPNRIFHRHVQYDKDVRFSRSKYRIGRSLRIVKDVELFFLQFDNFTQHYEKVKYKNFSLFDVSFNSFRTNPEPGSLLDF